MSSPKSTPGRGFTLRRNQSVAESSFDPCAGIEFTPSPCADELFEALKRAFPRGKNHKARMREAIIEFLIAEREAERSRSITPEVVRSGKAPQREQGSEEDGAAKQGPTMPSQELLKINVPAKQTSVKAKLTSPSSITGGDVTVTAQAVPQVSPTQ